LIRRADAARRLGCSLRALDNWARTGILSTVKLPGRVRAAGLRESDIARLIEGEGKAA
jgi:predicted site-specific integrase-resolvase